jgi:hypothetical protein
MDHREHWDNCVTHFDDEVDRFIAEYFADPQRRCLLVAGAGFDPRSRTIATKMAGALGDRLQAILIREERREPAAGLLAAADRAEQDLTRLIPNSEVLRVRIFAEDGAPIGGSEVTRAISGREWPEDAPDVVLDMSALSLGIGFPVAKLLLELCERDGRANLHLMTCSDPELDAGIVNEPDERVISVRGFAGTSTALADDLAQVWLPQLAPGRGPTLNKIRAANNSVYKVCPILPFPASDPRRADDLIAEFSDQFAAEWEVDGRDLLYVSERNPLDSFRKISRLCHRYLRSVEGVYTPQVILSPTGSKVMAMGALMAAIRHDLTVQYVETLRYEFTPKSTGSPHAWQRRSLVHLWLTGPIYAGYAGGPSVS